MQAALQLAGLLACLVPWSAHAADLTYLFNGTVENWTSSYLASSTTTSWSWRVDPLNNAMLKSPTIAWTPGYGDYIRLGMVNTGADQSSKWYFLHGGTTYTETNSVAFTQAGDANYHIYTSPLSKYDGAGYSWMGSTITGIRLDPVVTSYVTGDWIDIDFMFLRHDNAAPYAPSISAPNYWFKGPVTITVSGNDPPPEGFGYGPGLKVPSAYDTYASGISDFRWSLPGHPETLVNPYELVPTTGVASASFVVPAEYLHTGANTLSVFAFDKVALPGPASTATLYYDDTPPYAPAVQVSPGDWTNVNSFTFTWNNPGDPGCGVEHYEWAFDGMDQGYCGSTLTIRLPSGGDDHYVQVRAVDYLGNIGAWSAPVHPKLDDDQPVTDPVAVVPSDSSTTDQFTFNWGPGSDVNSGVGSYLYRVDEGTPVSTTQRAVAGAFAGGVEGEHTFDVLAVDRTGNWAAFWQRTRFHYYPRYLPRVTGLVPSSGQVALPQTFSWRSSGAGHRYQIQVSPDPGFTVQVSEFTSDVTWFMLPASAAPVSGQPYYWRVTSLSSAPLNWSAPVQVTPFVPPPPPVAQVIGQDFPAGEAGAGVNTSVGAVTRSLPILTLRGPGGEVPLTAWYSSHAQRNSLLGSRWNWTLGQLLTPVPGVGASVTLEDNQDLAFTQSGAAFAAGLGIYDSLASGGGGFTLIRPDRQKLTFDANGQLQSIADRSGNAVTPHYSGGVMTSFTDQAGRTYDVTVTNSRVTRITDALGGRTWNFEYDGAGYLSAFVDARGARTEYLYDGDGRLTRVTDPLGHFALRCAYDAQGRVSTQTDALDQVTTFAYDDVHRRTTVTDPLGGVEVHVHDVNSRLVADIDERGDSTTYTYDANHNRIVVRDGRGFTTRYQYDPRGNVCRIDSPLGDSTRTFFDGTNSPVQRIDALGQVTTYVNDSLGRPVDVQEPLSRVTHYVYDVHGQVVQETDANGHIRSNTYDSRGNLATSTNGAGDLLTYGYDLAGRRTSVTDALAHSKTYTYDAADHLLTESNLLGQTTTYVYDLAGRRTSTTDPRLQETVYEYDAKDRQVRVTDPLGNVTQNVYDVLDRLTKTIDARGGEKRSGYDAVGNLVSERDATGNLSTYTYDANHNRLSATDPRGKVTSYAYDALNRLLATTDPLGHVTSSTYDALGHVLSGTDARGNTTTFTYDALGRLAVVHAPNAHDVAYAYDPVGNLVTTTNGNGHASWRYYDGANRLTSIRDPLNGTESYVFDTAGRRIRRTDARGRVTLYGYDAADRIVQTTYGDSTKVLRGYDAAGNLTNLTDAWGSTTCAYDGDNRLTTVIDHYGKVLTFAYDSTGNLSELDYPGGEAVTYTYDPDNRLTSVTDWKGATIGYGYDANGNPSSVAHPNGVTTAMAYDDDSRLVRLIVRTPANDTLLSLDYTLDENGNRTRTVRVDRRTDITRGGGADVYATSAALSAASFPAGADSVVLASADEWSEALPAGYLARRLAAPALLLPGDNLWASPAARTELARLKTLRPALGAVVLGEVGGVSDLVEAQLQQQGIPVRRVRGADRAAAAASTAAASPLAVVVAAGDLARGPAAALLAGRLAAPLVFTERDSLPLASRAALATAGAARTILVGDENVIGPAVADWLDANGHRVWRRYGSSDGASLSACMLEDSVQVPDRFAKLQVASRDAWADALSAAAGPSPWGTATLIVAPDSIRSNPDVVRWLGRHKGWLQKTTLLGPASGVTANAEAELRNLMQTTVTEYTYSPLDELLSEIVPGVDTTAYTYDAVGNRASVTHAGVVSTYVYDGADRLVSAGPVTFTYDANGNRLTRTSGAVTSTYTYDFENRLTQIVGPEGTSKYRYDGNGMRIRADEPGRIVRYVVDPTARPYRTLREMDVSNVTLRSYVHGLGLASDLTKAGSVRYFHFDGLGSTAALTDSAGNDIGHLAYTAFGDTALDLGATATRLGYVGRFGVEGTASGLTFMRDRFYDAETGMFLSVDPEAGRERDFLAGAIYLYAGGDPVDNIDPDGRAVKKILKTAAASVKQAGKQMVAAVSTFVPAAKKMGSAIGTLVPAAKEMGGAIGAFAPAARQMARDISVFGPAAREVLNATESKPFQAGVSVAKNFSVVPSDLSGVSGLKLKGTQSLNTLVPSIGKVIVPVVVVGSTLDLIDRASATIHHRPFTPSTVDLLTR